ncbi:MAG: aspartate-semialdehyde dehydrogenase [Gammaproteobacteria bacterium]|nr:aspartate-semialdehyde dehydrogenase [Gammaproteobacteria bacterium]
MKKYNVALIGATGMVGESLISILQEREFPVNQLYPLASKRSLGKQVEFNSQPIEVIDLEEFDFNGIDFCFFSAGSKVSDQYAPIAANAGAIVIDNTSRYRYEDDIPLIVPEVNSSFLKNYKKRNIIANPNCSTIQLMVALAPIHLHSPIKKINIATYQSVSGAGRSAVELLNRQLKDINYPEKNDNPLFAHNVIPQIGDIQDNGYTLEEMKLVWETKKILGSDDIKVNATAVRVPVRVGHAEAVTIKTESKINLSLIKDVLSKAPNIKLFNDESYPMSILHGEGTDQVFVGRIREDLSTKNSINLWIVADNIRKGAALNSIQIAETIIKSYF